MLTRRFLEITFLLTVSVSVGKPAFAHGNHEATSPSCDLQTTTVSAPIDLSGRKPTVMATINGKGPFKFFLDTGAGAAVCFDKKLADELGLKAEGTTPVGDPSNPSAIEADVVRVESIAIGGGVFQNVNGLSWHLSRLSSGDDAPRGILGFPLFAKCLLTLDYSRSELRLEKGQLPIDDSPHVVPFTTDEGGIPQIRVTIAGTEMPAHLDSGAMSSISIPAKLEKKFVWLKEPEVVGHGRTANSEFEIRAGEIDGSVQFAGHTFMNSKVSLSPVLDRIEFANIGSGILKDFIVTIDSANHRMRLLRRDSESKGG